jgi:hypothetical protein
MSTNPNQTFLDRFSKKDLSRKQSFELPESVLDAISDYARYGKSGGVDVDTNQLVSEAVRDFLGRDRIFQSWRKESKESKDSKDSKESKDDAKTIKQSAQVSE